MSLQASDIVAYQSANMPENDSNACGGAINLNGLVVFTDLGANDAVGVVSDNAGDNESVTITGRLANGAIDSEVLVLNGTTRVPGAKTFERILKIVLGGAAAGVVTVDRNTGGAVIKAIPAGITSVRRAFYDSVSDSSPKVLYEKIFLKNTSGTFSLTNAVASLSADPSGKMKFALSAAKDDAVSVANRLAAPGGLTFVDEPTTQAVPGVNLGPGEAIGVWLQASLDALEAAIKSSVTVQLRGAST
ncbi:MAG: hypothetical protein KC643_33355 [Nitrospira sp.]|nr:hypothetical protein [Nitrospira sp.]